MTLHASLGLLPALIAGLAIAEDNTAASINIDMMRWEERIFKGSTRYRSVILDDERVLRAEARASASALYQEVDIDLTQTPYLSWRWLINETLDGMIDEQTKAGDDYVARIYVIQSGGLSFWRSKALNYVWTSGQAEGSRWNNAFGQGNVKMWSLDSGPESAGQWQSHTRDIRADWLEVFGEEIDHIDGVAIMTDTDNTGQFATAWYADIVFSAQAPE